MNKAADDKAQYSKAGLYIIILETLIGKDHSC